MTWTLSAFADEAGDTAEEQITALSKAGFNHIDLRGIEGHNIAELPFDVAQKVKGQLDEAGMTVNMFGSPIGKIDIADDGQIDLDRLAHLGKLAPVFDCRAVRIFSYFNRHHREAFRWRADSLERLRTLADTAARLGLVLYIENEQGIFGDRCERMLDIADQLHSTGPFRLIFDFDNYSQCDEDVWQNWTMLRDRTGAFHLKDSTAPPQSMHVPLGEGNGRVREILADALARGWTGSLSLEPHLSHSPAVIATHVHGHENRALKDLSPAESFQVGAEASRRLLDDIGAAYG